jgi:hypothetical protein
MTCPTCQSQSEVVDTRKHQINSIRRIRRCENGHRFATDERLAEIQPRFRERCPVTGLHAHKDIFAAQNRAIYGPRGGEPELCAHCGKYHLTQNGKFNKPKKQT